MGPWKSRAQAPIICMYFHEKEQRDSESQYCCWKRKCNNFSKNRAWITKFGPFLGQFDHFALICVLAQNLGQLAALSKMIYIAMIMCILYSKISVWNQGLNFHYNLMFQLMNFFPVNVSRSKMKYLFHKLFPRGNKFSLRKKFIYNRYILAPFLANFSKFTLS